MHVWSTRRCRHSVLGLILSLAILAEPAYASTITYFNGSASRDHYYSYPYNGTVSGGSVAPELLMATMSTVQTFWCDGPSGCPIVYYSTTSGGATSMTHAPKSNVRSRCKWFWLSGSTAPGSIQTVCKQW